MSDLIDRNDAVEAIEFEKVYMTAYKGSSKGYVSEGNPLKQYNKGLDDAIKAVNSIAPAEPEPKWIPVTEALPEKGTDVLVFCKDYYECPNYKELILPLKDVCSKWCNGDNDNTLLEFGCVHGNCGTCDVDNQGSWFPKMRIAYLDNNNEWDGDLSNDEIVVAWMTLPEPWRGEE